MRVICIDDDFSNIPPHHFEQLIELPKLLKTYTVIHSEVRSGTLGYVLKEVVTVPFPSGAPVLWRADRFVPCEDITEEIKEEIYEEIEA